MSKRNVLLTGTIIIGLMVVSVFFFLSRRPFQSERAQLVYTLNNSCIGFSSDGALLIGSNGVYDAGTGILRFQTGLVTSWAASSLRFSPDRKLIALLGEGLPPGDGAVYEMATGKRWFTMPWGTFSPDGKYLIAELARTVYDVSTGAVVLQKDGAFDLTGDGTQLIIAGDGVYDTATLQRKFAIGGGKARRGSADTLLAVSGDGVYELATGKRRFAIGQSDSIDFRPDLNLLLVKGDGIYELTTGRRLLDKFDAVWPDYNLSADSHWLAVKGDGIYSLAQGTRQMSLTSKGEVAFSPDAKYLISAGDGVYDVTTWQRKFAVGYTSTLGIAFNENGTQVAVNADGVYDLATGKQLFRVKDGGNFLNFVRDGAWVIIGGDAVYDTATGQRLFDAPGAWRINPSETELVVAGTGVYSLQTGAQRFALGFVRRDIRIAATSAFTVTFNPDGSLLWVPGDSVYDYTHGERLLDASAAWNVVFQPGDSLVGIVDQAQSTCQVFRIAAKS